MSIAPILKFIECRHYWQTPNKLRNEAEPDQIVGLGVTQQGTNGAAIIRRNDFSAKADACLDRTLANDPVQPFKRAANDKQDVGGVDSDKFLVGMFAPTLRRHRRIGAFNQFEQRLLNTLAGYVSSD